MTSRNNHSRNNGAATRKGAAPKIVAAIAVAAGMAFVAFGAYMLVRPPQANAHAAKDGGKDLDGITFVEPVKNRSMTVAQLGDAPAKPAVSQTVTPAQQEPAPTPAAEPVAAQAEARPSDIPQEPAKPAVEYVEPEYVDEEEYVPEPEPEYVEPAEVPAEEHYEEPVAPSVPAPVCGDAGMNPDEVNLAHEIFDRYNAWRASCGLPTTVWDGFCAEMAVNSAKGCAANKKLIHRLGIPGDLQNCYSDILQYASWRMTGDEAINRWSQSGGHAAQMRCPTAQNAACGVYQENGIYWFAIVYTFDGCNIG